MRGSPERLASRSRGPGPGGREAPCGAPRGPRPRPSSACHRACPQEGLSLCFCWRAAGGAESSCPPRRVKASPQQTCPVPTGPQPSVRLCRAVIKADHVCP